MLQNKQFRTIVKQCYSHRLTLVFINFYGNLLYMNPQENVINQPRSEKAQLEAQLVRVRADYNALNMIQTSVNNSLLDSNEEIRELKTELVLKNNEITALSNSVSDNVLFFQMLWTNYRFIQCQPLPMKLAIGGMVTYKICNKIMSSDENKKNLKEDTAIFSLIENPKVESLLPEPISKTQAVVEVSVVPIQQIKLLHSMWFPF